MIFMACERAEVKGDDIQRSVVVYPMGRVVGY